MKSYLKELETIKDLESLITKLKSKIDGHEEKYPDTTKFIRNLEETLKTHKQNVETSSEYI